MKTKTDIFTIIIAIIFLLAAGYFAYDKFLAPPEGNSIVSVETDAKCINEYYIGNGIIGEMSEENLEILDLMAQRDASHFKIVHDNSSYQLWQVPESDFSAVEYNSSIKDAKAIAIDMSRDYIMNFFNFSFEKIHECNSRIGYNSYVVEKSFDTSALNIEKKLQSYFNGNIDSFFINTELVLSCDDLQISKIGILESDNEFDPDNAYFLVGTANVTTVNASSDISKAWILPAPQKTKTIKIKALVFISKSEVPFTYTLSFDSICFE